MQLPAIALGLFAAAFNAASAPHDSSASKAGPSCRASCALHTEFDEAQDFLGSLDEINHLVGKVIRQLTPGLYQVNTGVPKLELFLVKQSQWFAVIRLPNPSELNLRSFIPDSVLGKPAFTAAIIVIAKTPGALQPAQVPLESSGLRTTLVSAMALVPASTIGAGVNLFAPFRPGDLGTFGQLKRAGVLPDNLLLVGTLTRGFTDQMFTTYGLSPRNAPPTDITLQLKAVGNGFVPAPFPLIHSPRLTFGRFEMLIARDKATLTLSGQQTGSTVQVGSNTVTIPSTKMTFTEILQGGYDITFEGAGTSSITSLFGIPRVSLDSIGVIGTVTSRPAPPDSSVRAIKGFGLDLVAWVRVDNNRFGGSFSATMTDAKVTDVMLDLKANLGLGFLASGLPAMSEFRFREMGVGVNPTSGAGYLLGTLDWDKHGSGTGALVIQNGAPTLFLHLVKPNLSSLMNGNAALRGLPTLEDALIIVGLAGDLTTGNLPVPVTQMMALAAGGTQGRITLADGLTLVTHLDATAVPGSAALKVTGPVMLAGSVDFKQEQMRILAGLSSVTLPALKGFGLQSPQLFISLSNPNDVPTLGVGIEMGMTVPINGDPSHPLLFTGDLTAATDGTLSALASMDSDWIQPLALKGITVLKPAQVGLTVSATGSVSIGLEGGVRVTSAKYGTQTFDSNAVCITFQPTLAPPYIDPDGFGIQLKASTLGVGTQVELWAALIESVTNGPLKLAKDPTLDALRAFIGKASDVVVARANAFPISQFTLNKAVLTLQMPTALCKVAAFSKGMQARIGGNAVFGGNPIAELDSYFNLVDGLKLYANLDAFKFGPQSAPFLTVNKAIIDVLVPTPGSPSFSPTNPGHFIVRGTAAVLGRTDSVAVIFDNKQATLAFAADLADVGRGNFLATTVGADFAHLTDFKLAFQAQSNLEAAVLRKLGAALQVSSAAHKKVASDSQAVLHQARAKANSGFSALDNTVGAAVRDAEKGLRECGAVCGPAQLAMQAAKAMSGYAEWAAKKATLETLDGADKVLAVVMRGWGVMDDVSATLLRGATSNLISLDTLAFDGHVNTTTGTLRVVVKVGGTVVADAISVNVGLEAEKAALKLAKLADKVAREVEVQAKHDGSAVSKAFRK